MSNNQAIDSQNAQHGEVFFAKFYLPDTGKIRKCPVFVLSTPEDIDTDKDVVAINRAGLK